MKNKGNKRKRIWIPYKIWDETEWFINFNKIIKLFERKKV